MKRIKLVILSILLAGLSSPGLLFAQKFPAIEDIASSSPLLGSLTINPNGVSVKHYRIQITDETSALKLSISGAVSDLDIYVQYEEPLDNYDYSDAYANTTDYNETIILSRLNSPALKSGTYYIDVLYSYSFYPEVEGRTLTKIDFTLTPEIIRAEEDLNLTPGEITEGSLFPDRGMTSIMAIEVPEETPNLRLDIVDSIGDLDLLLAYENPMLSWDNALITSSEYLTTESLVLSPKKQEFLSPGTYYVAIVDQLNLSSPETFTIIASFNEQVPEIIKDIPIFPTNTSKIDNAILATVELATRVNGGSGCIISPKGFILTNWHVVKTDKGTPSDNIYVNLSTDSHRPPFELFQAEVIDYDIEKDLALIQIISTRYGDPIPDNYNFPFLELTQKDFFIGDTIHILGYPAIGSTGSRVSITYSRGYISGFDPVFYGELIKTDAEINSGNSGGAALDENFDLIGIPTSVISENGGQLGFIHPANLMPEAWFLYF